MRRSAYFNRLALVLLVIPLLAGSSTGCKSAPIAPGADPLVVRAERATQNAFDTIHAFLEFELENRATLPQSVQHAANEMRRAGKELFPAVRAATKAYKASRDPADMDRVNDGLAAVENLARQARLYVAQHRSN